MEATWSAQSPASRLGLSAGRCFVGPWFDYLVIGGGLSLPLVALVVAAPGAPGLAPLLSGLSLLTRPEALPWVVLLLSSAHFAASTVRLYTKPGATRSLPFLTMGLPLVALGVLWLCLLYPGSLGRQLQALYLTWSPYHYAAQAYGLAVMYAYRSGCALEGRDKQLVRWASLLPFFYAFVSAPGTGLLWLLPQAVAGDPRLLAALAMLRPALLGLGLAAPFALWAWLARRRPGGAPLPLIAPLLLLANGLWWFLLPPLQAFLWATFFHGIQYLAIVVIFHVKDRTKQQQNRHGVVYHALWFYGACLALAYGLFSCLPRGFVLAGFSLTESLVLVVAAINVHHFIVDAFIWRLGRQDSNRSIVEASASPAPALGA